MKPRSLRTNLIFWLTFLFAIIIALSDYITYKAMRRIIFSELDSSLISIASLERAAFEENDALDLAAKSYQSDPRNWSLHPFFQIISATGQVMESNLSRSTGPLITEAQLDTVVSGAALKADSFIDGYPVRLTAIRGNREGMAFAIVIGTRIDSAEDTISRIPVLLLGMDIIAILVAIAGAYLIIGKTLKPVNHIIERAYQIGDGDLHQRIAQIGSTREMIRLTSVLNVMLDKLQRLFESQKKFVQDASHEVRSPLAALSCRLEVALRQPRTAEEYRQVMEGALKDATRLKALTEDLFLLARADSDAAFIELREVDLPEILAVVHEQLKPLAETRGIDFSLDAQAGCKVYGDFARLTQAFRNVAENALKYTSKGGHAYIRVRQEGDLIRTEIEDSGIGIPEAEQENIFRRFYRVDRARSRSDGGTGLGLAICDQIIRAHHGRIEVASTPAVGTRFTIYLDSAAALVEKNPF